MVDDAAHRVTEFLLDKVDDGLRTVVIVEPADFDIVYLSDDLQRTYSRQAFADVVDTFRLDTPFWDPGIDQMPVGSRRAVLHYHTNAFVLQFPYSDTETILISVTPEVGRDLLGFIDQCRKLVSGDVERR